MQTLSKYNKTSYLSHSTSVPDGGHDTQKLTSLRKAFYLKIMLWRYLPRLGVRPSRSRDTKGAVWGQCSAYQEMPANVEQTARSVTIRCWGPDRKQLYATHSRLYRACMLKKNFSRLRTGHSFREIRTHRRPDHPHVYFSERKRAEQRKSK